MTVTFNNVQIVIDAPDAAAAYEQLCNALATIPCAEYATDTFTTDAEADRERPTSVLWPEV